jgi:hypothetical protein
MSEIHPKAAVISKRSARRKCAKSSHSQSANKHRDTHYAKVFVLIVATSSIVSRVIREYSKLPTSLSRLFWRRHQAFKLYLVQPIDH